MLQEHLAQAEAHVLRGEQHIARQRALIAELERDRHDTALARALLKQLEETQRLHIADRERLREELAKPA